MFGFGSGLGTVAKNAATTAGNVGAGYGADASNVSSQLLPFLTRELNNPTGYTQQQRGAMLGAAEGGAGGATAGLNTEANLAAARNRNSGSLSGAIADASRQKDKALASTSEGIEAQNAGVQQQQQQAAASGLAGLHGQDVEAQLKSMGLIPEAVNASIAANKAPWDTLGNFLKNAGSAAGSMGV
jgi:hypothetical protein